MSSTPPHPTGQLPFFAPKNAAAWALKPKSKPLVVDNAPYTKPPKGHIVIKVYDVAVNPVDWILQEEDPEKFGLRYPAVLGYDVAGEVVEVGEGVKDFQLGGRVIAHCARSSTAPQDLPPASTGGFQKFVVVQKSSVAELPSEIRTSNGVVLPLSISTASAALFQKDTLKLSLPPINKKAEPLNRTILIWGGSSSVGSSAIQLAIAAGAEVITTCSEKNFDYVKSLGAKATFDYHEKDVEDRIVEFLKGKTCVGAFHAVGEEGVLEACARIVDRSKGKAVVVSVKPVPEGGEGIPRTVRLRAVKATDIFENEVGPYIWREFLPLALKSKKILPKPDPKIVGEELRSVQAGLDAQKKGVSAKKIVVSNISQ